MQGLGQYAQAHARLWLQVAQATATATGSRAKSQGHARSPIMCTICCPGGAHAAHAHHAHKHPRSWQPRRILHIARMSPDVHPGAGTRQSLALKHTIRALPAFEP